MNLEFINVKALKSRPYASIESIGKMYFNKAATEYMGMTFESSYKIAKSPEDKHIYLVPATPDDIHVTPVKKQGISMYLNIRYILKDMGVDPDEGTIKYLVSKTKYKGTDIFALKRVSTQPRKKSKIKVK